MIKLKSVAGISLFILVLFNITTSKASMGISASQNELEYSANWFDKLFADGKNLPVSFIYDDKPSDRFISMWTFHKSTTERTQMKEQWIFTATDPRTKLSVKCIGTRYLDFPAIEWVIEFQNNGTIDTPILENIQACDINLYPDKDEFLLHYAQGSDHNISDFAPLLKKIDPQSEFVMTPTGGRSSDETAFPFFNLQAQNEGVMVAIGWTGQWQSKIIRKENKGISLVAGMERTHLKLLPGEKIRTPRMLLLFWQDQDRLRGHNLFRQFILKHHTPQHNGLPIQGPLACNGGAFMFNEFTLATEHNMIALAERYKQFGLQAEYWWIDAGWYGSMEWKGGGWYQNVGNWYIRKEHFPNGLRPVSDAVKKMGMKLILWFEPERVSRETWLFKEHPEWILIYKHNKNNGILNLGDPEALQWVTDYVSNMITEQGIALYRQDFNIRPLEYWRNMDAPDRQGITEIRHIEGLYAFWDELLRRHPGLIIDNCASGGRRLDLETISRSIPLWRTDYNYNEPNGRQNHTYGLSFYLPCHGTGNHNLSLYNFRSSYSSAIVCGWNLYETDFPKDLAKYMLSEYKKIRPYFYGDYYPLTDYSKSYRNWIGYQFYRQDLKEGMALLFRRPHCQDFEKTIHLSGLEENALYEVIYEDSGGKIVKTGKELLNGFNVKLLDRSSSMLITFKQTKSSNR